MTEDYCDLTPSEGNRRWPLPVSQAGRNPCEVTSIHHRTIPDVPGQPSLFYLKERVCRLLYSSQGMKCTNGELLLNIRQLDAQLESWRISLPRHLCPSLSIPRSYRPIVHDASEEHSMLRVNLQLEYYYLMIVIHATVRRCRAANNESDGIPEDLHSVLHSSTDLSLEASRSTLAIMKKHTKTMVIEGSQ